MVSVLSVLWVMIPDLDMNLVFSDLMFQFVVCLCKRFSRRSFISGRS